MSTTPSEVRPLYSRSSTRAHVTVDASGAVEGAYVVHTGGVVEANPGPPSSVNYV